MSGVPIFSLTSGSASQFQYPLKYPFSMYSISPVSNILFSDLTDVATQALSESISVIFGC